MAQIITKFITDDAVTNAKVADNAVDSAQIASGAVIEAKIGALAVSAGKLAANAVETAKIAADAVTDAKIRLSNNAYLRGRNAADSADIDIVKVNASDALEFASFPQKSGTPSNANDLANKSYVDSVSGGSAGAIAKKAVMFVYDGASDPLTVGTAGTHDGYTPSIGDRFLSIGSFDTNSDRGIYEVTGANLSIRPTDADTAGDFEFGQMVNVKFGDVYGSSQFVLMTSAAITLGTTVLDYRQMNVAHKQSFTLSGGDITNQYVDLAFIAKPNTVRLLVGGVEQWEGVDFTLSIAGGVTRLTFAGQLATGGAAELVASDVLRVQFVKASY